MIWVIDAKNASSGPLIGPRSNDIWHFHLPGFQRTRRLMAKFVEKQLFRVKLPSWRTSCPRISRRQSLSFYLMALRRRLAFDLFEQQKRITQFNIDIITIITIDLLCSACLGGMWAKCLSGSSSKAWTTKTWPCPAKGL